jgi:hypothetical protein
LSLVEQELLTFRSTWVHPRFLVARSLVFYVVFCRSVCLSVFFFLTIMLSYNVYIHVIDMQINKCCSIEFLSARTILAISIYKEHFRCTPLMRRSLQILIRQFEFYTTAFVNLHIYNVYVNIILWRNLNIVSTKLFPHLTSSSTSIKFKYCIIKRISHYSIDAPGQRRQVNVAHWAPVVMSVPQKA